VSTSDASGGRSAGEPGGAASQPPDWALLDGIAQAELVRSGAVSAEELWA
jgi:hypothetical protein